MQAWEWAAVAYFVYLLALAPRLSGVATARLLAGVAVAIVAVVVAAHAPQTAWLVLGRRWLPAACVLLGYYLSALFFRAPMPAWEARLAAFDERWLERTGLLARLDESPRLVREGLELAYFVCPAIVPLGAFVLGASPPLADLNRYWTPMLLAEFVSFAALPWIQTRPPRAVEAPRAVDDRTLARRLNHWMVRYGHHGYNTFPSGHVAAAWTAAFVGVVEAPHVGATLVALAAAITVGAVVGRYHYLLDAIAGALVAVAAMALAWSLNGGTL